MTPVDPVEEMPKEEYFNFVNRRLPPVANPVEVEPISRQIFKKTESPTPWG
jgi:hypothetical protein